jgi:hypothetical protein
MPDPKKSEPILGSFTPRTKEEIALALAERKRDASMLIPPAPWGAAERPNTVVVQHESTVQAVDRSELTKKKAELDKQLEEASLLVVEAESRLHAQKLLETDAVKAREAERMKLVQQKDAAQQAAIKVQQELQELEALALLAEQEADARQRDQAAEVPAARFEAAAQKALEPMILKTATGYGGLTKLLQKHESTLTRIDALRAPTFNTEDERVSYMETSGRGGRILRELKDVIREHHQVLQAAAGFKPQNSADGHRKIAELQHRLELTSGVVLADRGAWVKLAGDTVNQSVKATSEISSKEYNDSATTVHVDRFTDMIAGFLKQFSDVAKTTPRPLPTIEITLIPKESKPRSQVMAELRGPKPEQTRAAGVPEQE